MCVCVCVCVQYGTKQHKDCTSAVSFFFCLSCWLRALTFAADAALDQRRYQRSSDFSLYLDVSQEPDVLVFSHAPLV